MSACAQSTKSLDSYNYFHINLSHKNVLKFTRFYIKSDELKIISLDFTASLTIEVMNYTGGTLDSSYFQPERTLFKRALYIYVEEYAECVGKWYQSAPPTTTMISTKKFSGFNKHCNVFQP